MNNLTKNLLLWLFVAFILMALLSNGLTQKEPNPEMEYSDFLIMAKNGQVARVVITEMPDSRFSELTVEVRHSLGSEPTTYTVIAPPDPGLTGDLIKNGIEFEAKEAEKPSFLVQMLISWFPLILIIGVWIYLMRQMQGGGGKGGAMSFGKSKARMLTDENNNTTFEDVAGCDEAKEEVQELVEFLRDPSKFHKLGGHIPRGVLMMGQPGTGKTLLAKAVAGEAGAPFFSISGSDFVEMFVGVGASRVRDMFEQAKKAAPCIIFIDEIDAVGRQRGAGLGGGHDEREQTLNQLLTEMDGFETNTGIIVIAATNRPDVLDQALLRPGRFDRQVVVPLPDIRGREQILKVHVRKIPLAKDVVLSILARGTPGFSGADLENLINEAALFAARASKKLVDMEDFESAKDKVVMGAERRSVVMPKEERLNTSYHESGHTVVAKVLKGYADPVHKVTIIPRGRALGVTMQLPEEDKYSQNREYLLARIAVLCGGRIAEKVFMGQETTGASNDFEHATDIAENMVKKWGMSKNKKLGHRTYGGERSQPFAGQTFGYGKEDSISPETQTLIDLEINEIIDEQYDRAWKIIEGHREKIEVMAQALMDWETLDAIQIDDIMAGRKPRRLAPPPSQQDEDGSQKEGAVFDSETEEDTDFTPSWEDE